MADLFCLAHAILLYHVTSACLNSWESDRLKHGTT